MRQIKVSEEVWEEIAKRGKFGETPDDVLRKVFDLKPNGAGSSSSPPARALPGNTLHEKWDGRRLTLSFDGTGLERSFDLPANKEDKRKIRAVLDEALRFGETNRASKGQLLAIRKAFTSHGYHIRSLIRARLTTRPPSE